MLRHIHKKKTDSNSWTVTQWQKGNKTYVKRQSSIVEILQMKHMKKCETKEHEELPVEGRTEKMHAKVRQRFLSKTFQKGRHYPGIQ